MLLKIWQPRWHDRKVLLSKYKVDMSGSYIDVIFTKTKLLPGVYTIRKEDIMKHPLETNGKILCYSIPLNKLRIKNEK